MTPDCLHHVRLLSGQHHKVGEVVGDLQNVDFQDSGRRELVTAPCVHLISEVCELIRRDLVRSLRVPQVLYRLPRLVRGVEGVEALDVSLLLGDVEIRRLRAGDWRSPGSARPRTPPPGLGRASRSPPAGSSRGARQEASSSRG